MSKLLVPHHHGALTRMDKARLQLFVRTVGKELVGSEIDEAIEQCEIYGANPFTRDIYFFTFGEPGTPGRKVVPVLSIGLYRKNAARSGDYRPDDLPARFTYDEALVGPDNPKGIVNCEVGVYRFSHGSWFKHVERLSWDERAPIIEGGSEGFEWVDTGFKKPDGKPKFKKVPKGDIIKALDPNKPNWINMPETMLSKCFSSDTEVLTSAGFQRFDALTDPVLQVTPQGLEPVSVAAWSQAYSGHMIFLDSDDLNFSVTPNHDMITTAGKVEAAIMFEGARARPAHFIPRIVPGAQIDADISDTAIKIAAAILADGSKNGGAFIVGVSRDYKIAELDALAAHRTRRIARRAGEAAYTLARVITTQKDKVCFRYDLAAAGGLCTADKRVDLEMLLTLSRRQAKLFVDTLVLFDGSENGNGVRRFGSSSGRLMGAFEVAAVMAGYAVSPRRLAMSDIAKKPHYVVSLSERDAIPICRWGRQYKYHQNSTGRFHRTIERTKNTNGVVWCVTVPSGEIVVRRNGFSMRCGNCVEVAAIRKGWPEATSGSYVDGELDSAKVIELTATEILAKADLEDRQARVGGSAILIDWMDGESIVAVPADQLHGQVMDFFKEHLQPGHEELSTILQWREKNREGLRQFWALKGSEALHLKGEFEKIERRVAETGKQ